MKVDNSVAKWGGAHDVLWPFELTVRSGHALQRDRELSQKKCNLTDSPSLHYDYDLCIYHLQPGGHYTTVCTAQ
jgi:hypothetical protein